MTEKIIAYDIVLKRPACVLIQAAMGCDYGLAQHFDPDTWLLDITPNMRKFRVTPEQLKKLVKITEANR